MTGFALLGCGRIGKLHARNIAAHPRAELVACYDVAAAEAVARDTGARAVGSVLDFFVERYREAYVAELDHFAACVEAGTAPLAGFAEGREALRLADAALESPRTGRAVRVAPAPEAAAQASAAQASATQGPSAQASAARGAAA